MNKSTLADYALVIVYKVILDAALIYFVLPIYGNEVQYSFHERANWLTSAISYVLALSSIWAFSMIRRDARVTRFVLCVQLLLVIIPGAVLYGEGYLAFWHIGLIVAAFIIAALVARVAPVPHLKPPRSITRGLLIYLMSIIIAYVYVGLIATGGLGRLNVNFADVYEMRDQYAKSLLPGFGYFVPWVAYVLNMAWLVSAMQRDKRILTALILCMQILLFAMTNFKAYLIVPFAVIIFVKLAKRMDAQRVAMLGAPAVVGLLLGLGASGIKMGGGMLDRMFFIPAALHGLYFNYFSSHPFSMMGGTQLGKLMGSPYDQNSVHVIAQEYWGRMFSPNVGWVGDAYANFGIFGIFISAIIFGLILRLGDNLAGRFIRAGVAEGLMVGSALALCSSALSTDLLTHGLAIAMVVLWASRAREKDRQKEPEYLLPRDPSVKENDINFEVR